MLQKFSEFSSKRTFHYAMGTFLRKGDKKVLLSIFFPVASTNVGICLNFLTFSFNRFTTLVKKIKAIPSANPKLLNLNQAHPSKKLFFGQIFIKLLLR